MSNEENECNVCHTWGPNGEVIPVHHPEHHSWTTAPSSQISTLRFWPTRSSSPPTHWNDLAEPQPEPNPSLLDKIRMMIQEENELLYRKIQTMVHAEIFQHPKILNNDVDL